MDPFRRRLIELSRILTDDAASYSYLLQRLERAGRLRCVGCGFESFYLLSRCRLKCRRCRREFRPLVGTMFSALNMSLSGWLSMVNFFVMEVPVQEAAARARVNYKTALRAYTLIRRAIVEPLGQGGELGEPVGSVAIGIIDDVERAELILLDAQRTLALLESGVSGVRKGMIFYTDLWQEFHTVLVLCTPGGWRPRKSQLVEEVYVDHVQGFWQYAKRVLLGNRAINRGNVIVVLQELQWRYNTRQADQFELIVDRMLATPTRRGKIRPASPEVTASA